MNIETQARYLLNRLENPLFDDKQCREMAINMLQDVIKNAKRSCNQTKDFMLQMAKESGYTEFRLIGRVNDTGLELMEWCEDAYNFGGMCPNKNDNKTYKDGNYHKRTYTLKELPEVIDNALEWHNSVKKQNKFRHTNLHIQAIK